MIALLECRPQVRNAVNEAVLAGSGAPDLTDYVKPLQTGRNLDVSVVGELFDETTSRTWPNKPASDRWLGPRLHAALRLTRSEAARDGIWTWLGLSIGYQYTLWRWGPEIPSGRFIGASYTHALGRLWWTTELFRNGADYGPAVTALSNQDIIQNFLRMDVAHHRPTVQAFLQVPSRRGSDQPLGGREANALAKAVNCAATTLAYELIGPDLVTDPEIRSDWLAETVPLSALLGDTLPAGPGEPPAPASSVEALVNVFVRVFRDAPIRGKDPDEADPSELVVLDDEARSRKSKGKKSTKGRKSTKGKDGRRSIKVDERHLPLNTERTGSTADHGQQEDQSNRIRPGDLLRYPRDPRDEQPTINGLRNWFHLTSAPAMPRVMLERGINVPARTARGRLPVVVLRSSPHKAGTHTTPWFDRLSDDGRTYVYFGDNKANADSESADTWAHPRPGNAALIDLAATHRSIDRSDRAESAPIIVVRTVPHDGREKGQIEIVGVGTVAEVEQVTELDPDERPFENYRFEIRLLDLGVEGFDWAWITARRSDRYSTDQLLGLAPRSWREWVEGA